MSSLIMQKLMSTPYLVLLIVLGGITITTVLATTTTTITTYPYVITDGTNQRLLIASNGHVGIGNSGTNPPGLLNVRELADNNLNGLIFQNTAASGSLRLWIDSTGAGYITNAGTPRITIATNGTTNFPNSNVAIGKTTATARLDIAGGETLTGTLSLNGGNMTATPAKQFKISTTNGKDICIGSC